jgi:hypothetical protein
MRTKLIFGLVAVCIAAGAFVAGMLFERNFPSVFASSSNTPTLLSPAEGAVLKTDVPEMWEFSWSKVPKAEKYHVYICHSGSLNFPFANTEVEVPFYRLNSHANNFNPRRTGFTDGPLIKGWTWKIKAQVGGEWSKWSEVRTFDTIEAKAQ